MPGRFLVRRFRASDLDRILTIEHASFGEDAYDRNLFAEYAHECGALFLVVERARRVWGYMLTCTGGRGDIPRAEIISIAIDPAARTKGAATVLMDSTLRRLRLRKIPRLDLMVRTTNAPALAFYKKYEFRKVRIIRRYYEDGADAQLMTRTETTPMTRPRQQ